MDVVESHNEGNEDQDLDEREEEVAEDTAEHIGIGKREVGERRGDDEDKARAEQLTNHHAKDSEDR